MTTSRLWQMAERNGWKEPLFEINEPRPCSDWQCEVLGGPLGLCIRPERGKEPNWFWRWTQYLVLGFRWRWNPLEHNENHWSG